ncbi:right-handed parallel beta-helix repeat-containing protein [Lysinibacillus sp. LZ02]|uniref:right-handed parallel beta-helix repeat-containing protein n=1 Tax=Lysinibacillus sp. LZ02 TaxID=3420668 RepID=UPI003D361808
MAIIKVSTSIFSAIRTIERALAKANLGDEIQLASGLYKESIQFEKIVSVVGRNGEETIIEGLLIIPKNVIVTFEQITFIPTAQIYIEGKAIFKDCHFQGKKTSAILSLNKGKAELEDCTLMNATDVGIAIFNESSATIKNCLLESNGKSQILLESSHLSIDNCELTQSTHGIWLKKNATVHSHNNYIHHHSGTQMIVQENSTWIDATSTIEHGEGNGIYASKHANVELSSTTIQHHKLPQIWMQESNLSLSNSTVKHGNESGIMLREYATAEIEQCTIANHRIANIQTTLESRLNINSSQLYSCDGVGVQVREKSIANFNDTTFSAHVLSQLFITEQSITSLKNCTFKEGKQVGILIEKQGNCTIVESTLKHHENTAITVIDGELMVIGCEITDNEGNGILAVTKATVNIENSCFYGNEMPHIAGKSEVNIQLHQSELYDGKSLYVLDQSQLTVIDCNIYDGDGVQVEISDQTKAKFDNCIISSGKTNGLKAYRDSSLLILNCQILKHAMPQIVLNDSSLIMKDTELLEGERNGLIIENNSEAFIQDTFISKHAFPQIWIDLESNVELKSAQITEGEESDIYVQNKSTLHASNCIIRNDKFQFNVQAVNHSNITLEETIVDNYVGEKFYSENNSTITNLLDEVSD